MQKFTLTLTGTAPLLMHNVALADEFNPVVLEMKKITAKKTKKTEDDRWELRRLEFVGSLYYDADLGPYIPAEMIEASIREGAKVSRNGKDVQRGLRITSAVNPLAYKGPRAIDELWKDENFRDMRSVRVTSSRIVRTRPIFRNWMTQAEGIIDTEVLDLDALTLFLERAGGLMGIGDYRPRFGTYTAEIEVNK